MPKCNLCGLNWWPGDHSSTGTVHTCLPLVANCIPVPWTCLVCGKPTTNTLWCENCKDSPKALRQVKTFTDGLFNPENLHREIKGLLEVIAEKDKELGASQLQVEALRATLGRISTVAFSHKCEEVEIIREVAREALCAEKKE